MGYRSSAAPRLSLTSFFNGFTTEALAGTQTLREEYCLRYSHLSGIVRPMQQRLSLFATAIKCSLRTILLELRDVTPHGAPSFDLSLVVRTTASHKVAAVPLKPTARVFVIDPTFLLPNPERLRCVHPKIIQIRIVTLVTEPGAPEPGRGKLFTTVSQVLATKYPQLQHLFRCQLRVEVRMKILAGRFSEVVDIAALDEVVNGD